MLFWPYAYGHGYLLEVLFSCYLFDRSQPHISSCSIDRLCEVADSSFPPPPFGDTGLPPTTLYRSPPLLHQHHRKRLIEGCPIGIAFASIRKTVTGGQNPAHRSTASFILFSLSSLPLCLLSHLHSPYLLSALITYQSFDVSLFALHVLLSLLEPVITSSPLVSSPSPPWCTRSPGALS